MQQNNVFQYAQYEFFTDHLAIVQMGWMFWLNKLFQTGKSLITINSAQNNLNHGGILKFGDSSLHLTILAAPKYIIITRLYKKNTVRRFSQCMTNCGEIQFLFSLLRKPSLSPSWDAIQHMHIGLCCLFCSFPMLLTFHTPKYTEI